MVHQHVIGLLDFSISLFVLSQIWLNPLVADRNTFGAPQEIWRKNKHYGKKNDCECFEEWNARLYVNSIFQNAHEVFYTLRRYLQIHYQTTNRSFWRSNKPLYVVSPWGRVLDKLRWPSFYGFTHHVKTSNKIHNKFGGMLIESKNLQGISFSEMPHGIFSLRYLVGINEIYKQATHCVMILPCMVSAKLNQKLSILDVEFFI